jgi:hypothetical protein
MGTDLITIAEAPPSAGPELGDTPIWDAEFADRWARILRGDDGAAAGHGEPVRPARPPRKPRVKK